MIVATQYPLETPPYGSHGELPDGYASAAKWAMHVILPCSRVHGMAYCGVLGVLRQGSLGGLLRLVEQLQGLGTPADINSAPYPEWDGFNRAGCFGGKLKANAVAPGSVICQSHAQLRMSPMLPSVLASHASQGPPGSLNFGVKLKSGKARLPLVAQLYAGPACVLVCSVFSCSVRSLYHRSVN